MYILRYYKIMECVSDKGHYGLVRYLADNGSDIHVDGNYALRAASGNGQLTIVKYPVENGADMVFWMWLDIL